MSKMISFTIFLSAIAFATNAYELSRVADNAIANILLKSTTLVENNPQRSMECFTIYIPKLNEITAKYEEEYETCLNRSADARNLIDAEVQSDRKDLELSVLDVCGEYEKCTLYIPAYEGFECYNEVSSNATKVAYNIQNASKDKMDYIKVKFETIEYEQKRCTDECSRVYVEESTKTYSDLDKCLAGVTV